MTKFEFDREDDGSLSIESAVAQALGYASVCWTETPTGVFESDNAKDAVDTLVAFIKVQGGVDSRVVPDESDGDILTRLGTDAEKWAHEFVWNRPGVFRETIAEMEHTVLGWFANAIEAGRTAGYGEAKREANPNWPLKPDVRELTVDEALQELDAATDDYRDAVDRQRARDAAALKDAAGAG